MESAVASAGVLVGSPTPWNFITASSTCETTKYTNQGKKCRLSAAEGLACLLIT